MAQAKPQTTDSLTALVVDDAAPMRQLVSSMLRSFGGFEIVLASDGEAALGVTRESKAFDLIICDIEMEPMDGVSFLRTLRGDGDNPSQQCPVIMLTGNRDEKSVLGAKEAGMNGYLIKPISPAKLRRRIEAVLPEDQASAFRGEKNGGSARNGGSTSKSKNALALNIVKLFEQLEKIKKTKGEDLGAWRELGLRLEETQKLSKDMAENQVSATAEAGLVMVRRLTDATSPQPAQRQAYVDAMLSTLFLLRSFVGMSSDQDKFEDLEILLSIIVRSTD